MPTKVWVAFSDVLWTKKVRKLHQGDGSASASRAKRMQEYTVDQLGKAADAVADAFQLGADPVASASRLTSLVWEYAKDEGDAKGRTHYSAIDTFDPKKRNYTEWQSAHGVSMRSGEALPLGERASKLSPSNRDKLMASAVVLQDPLGMVQELNVTRLKQIEERQRYLADKKISRPLLISQSIMGLKALIGEQTAAAITQDEQAKGLPDVQTETVYIPDDLPSQAQTLTSTTTRKERIDAKFVPLWQSLQEHYREGERAAFEATVAKTLKSFKNWVIWTDADYAHWLGQPEWVARRDDYDREVPEQQDRLIEALTAALQGGPTNDPANAAPVPSPQDTKAYEIWAKFMQMAPNDPLNPIYAALFGNQKEFLDYLLPDGPVPLQDHINKGSKLYKVIKTVIGTKELSSNTLSGVQSLGARGILTREAAGKVPNPVRAAGSKALDIVRGSWVPKAAGAAAQMLLAIGGALSRLAANGLSEIYQHTALRAIQGAVMLYERREIFLVTSRIRVREYLAYLNDVAFRSADTVLSAASRTVRRVVQAGKQTVRSMAVAGTLHISDPKVRDAFIDVLAWAQDDLNGIARAIDELAPQQQAARAAHQANQAANAAESAGMAAAMRVHPFNLSPQAGEFVQSITAKARAVRLGSAQLLESVTRSSLRLVSTGSGILAVGSLVMQGWSLVDNWKKAEKTFLGSNEARLLVVAGSVATLGAILEVAGVAGKLASMSWATAVGRIGGALGAAASIVEGIQAGMASIRTYGRGDSDASRWYAAAALALLVGGAVGIYGALAGAALLGPVGLAVALIAAGVVSLYFAAKAEDSQAAIWLERCYWGTGQRFKNAGNALDRPWEDKEINEELAQLNAIIIGLSGETGFNDDWLGMGDFFWDTVKAKVTFPNFDAGNSAFEWQLRAVNRPTGRRVVLAGGKSIVDLPADPDAIVVQGAARHRAQDNTEYFRNVQGPNSKREGKNHDLLTVEVSVEVRVKYFGDVELTAEYVPDVTDPRGRAYLALSERH